MMKSKHPSMQVKLKISLSGNLKYTVAFGIVRGDLVKARYRKIYSTKIIPWRGGQTKNERYEG